MRAMLFHVVLTYSLMSEKVPVKYKRASILEAGMSDPEDKLQLFNKGF